MKGLKVKLALGFLVLTAATSVLAKGPLRYEIEALTQLKFDGQNLEFSYSVGGGCQPHTTEVEVAIVPAAQPAQSFIDYNAEIKIYDVTPALDMCEAMLFLTEKVDLRLLIQQKAKAMGVEAYRINAILPKATVDL